MKQLSAYYKPTTSLFQPIVEEHPGTWSVVSKNLISDITVHDSAHICYKPTDRRISCMKNCL